jgi:hypothetical protein
MIPPIITNIRELAQQAIAITVVVTLTTVALTVSWRRASRKTRKGRRRTTKS